MYYRQQQQGFNPSIGLNALNAYKDYQSGTGLFGLFNSGAGASSGAVGAEAGSIGAGNIGAGSVGAEGVAGMGGLGAMGMFALPAYILGGLAGGTADPETFGKLPLVGTTGEALNGLFNGKGLTEFFDTDNIAQHLLPGIGDFLPDKTSDQLFKPVQQMFGNIFGF